MNNLKIIIPIIIGVIVAGGGFVGYTMYEENQKEIAKAEAKARAEQEAEEARIAQEAAVASRTKCPEVPGYFVVTLDRDGGVGQDIFVDKKIEGQTCKYQTTAEGFEVKNSDPEYFRAIGATTLVTDVGTGPSGRSIRLYDLTEKKLITEKQYFGELTISSSTLVYNGLAKQKADTKNCKDFKKITDDGFTPNLVVEKTIDLKTLSVKEAKTTSCVSSQ